MKKILLTTAAVAALSGAAFAADMPLKGPRAPAAPPAFDIAFGGAIMTDYNFRGISQSDRRPSETAYFEGRYNINSNWQVYAGVQGWGTKLPTQPTGEFDLYGGIRPTFGPLALDFGFIYYYYPGEVQQFFADAALTGISPTNFGFGAFTIAQTDFWEVYGKATYTFNDYLAVGVQVYYSPDYLNSNADGLFVNGNVKISAPSAWFWKDWGGYISGDVGHYWLGTATNTANGVPFNLPDYTTWDVGVAVTYKVFTFDVRYYDTDLSKGQCFALTGDPRGVISGQSRWCGESVVAKLSADITVNGNLK